MQNSALENIKQVHNLLDNADEMIRSALGPASYSGNMIGGKLAAAHGVLHLIESEVKELRAERDFYKRDFEVVADKLIEERYNKC